MTALAAFSTAADVLPTIAIAVPARDEAESLPALLAALEGQVGIAPEQVTLCFHLDACRDASEAIVRGWRARSRVLVSAADAPDANAGRARRAAMALAEASGAALLLTTDADSVPAPDWIASAARSLASADVVAGRIIRRNAAADPGQTRVERYYDRLHELRRALDPVPWEPEPRHHQTGGANLAFRADAYRALDGFDRVASGEDALIVDRAQRLGLRVRRDARVAVETSSRRCGRAPAGLAAVLARLDGGALLGPVAHPADEARRYRGHALARAAWTALPTGTAQLATALGLPEAEVIVVAAECANAEGFATRIVPPPPGGIRLVSLATAEQALARLEAGGRAAAA